MQDPWRTRLWRYERQTDLMSPADREMALDILTSCSGETPRTVEDAKSILVPLAVRYGPFSQRRESFRTLAGMILQLGIHRFVIFVEAMYEYQTLLGFDPQAPVYYPTVHRIGNDVIHVQVRYAPVMFCHSRTYWDVPNDENRMLDHYRRILKHMKNNWVTCMNDMIISVYQEVRGLPGGGVRPYEDNSAESTDHHHWFLNEFLRVCVSLRWRSSIVKSILMDPELGLLTNDVQHTTSLFETNPPFFQKAEQYVLAVYMDAVDETNLMRWKLSKTLRNELKWTPLSCDVIANEIVPALVGNPIVLPDAMYEHRIRLAHEQYVRLVCWLIYIFILIWWWLVGVAYHSLMEFFGHTLDCPLAYDSAAGINAFCGDMHQCSFASVRLWKNTSTPCIWKAPLDTFSSFEVSSLALVLAMLPAMIPSSMLVEMIL